VADIVGGSSRQPDNADRKAVRSRSWLASRRRMTERGGWTVQTKTALAIPQLPAASRRRIWAEILVLLALSLGKSGVYAVVNLISRLTLDTPLASQSAALNQSLSPRPYVDLTYQILGIVFGLAPVALAIFFLHNRPGFPSARAALGLDWCTSDKTNAASSTAITRLSRIRSDLAWGFALFGAIGIPGVGFYLLGRAIGITVQVSASGLADYWWTIPVLILSAFENGALEEVIVVGYLFERTRDLGWNRGPGIDWRFVAFSALLRGSYHLYQGIGPFIGNLIMGVVFAIWYRSNWGRNRVIPLIVAHTLMDIVAFVGYALLPDAWAIWLGVR